MIFSLLRKKDKAYSLVEILIALIIISTVMIIATSTIYGSSVVSINNEIADRANTMMVRILELVKKADNSIAHCDEDVDVEILNNNYYAIGNIDLTNANELQGACIRPVADTQQISTCNDTSLYKTVLKLPEGFVEYEELYCIQLYVEDIEGSGFDKITVTTVFDDISEQNIKKLFYGLY